MVLIEQRKVTRQRANHGNMIGSPAIHDMRCCSITNLQKEREERFGEGIWPYGDAISREIQNAESQDRPRAAPDDAR